MLKESQNDHRFRFHKINLTPSGKSQESQSSNKKKSHKRSEKVYRIKEQEHFGTTLSKGQKENAPQEQVRDHIFQEVKRLRDHGDLSAEERLQNILERNIPLNSKSFSYSERRRSKAQLWKVRKIGLRLSYPISFGALRGNGLILASGRRTFDFLLLDWKPSLEALVPVLRIHEDATFMEDEVKTFCFKLL